MISLKIAVDAPDLSHWRTAVDPVELHEEVGREYAGRLRGYFELKDATPNAKGFPRTNFWRGIADSTEFEGADATGATVKISDGRFALRYFGGTVTPKNAGALAIPLKPEVAGMSPREIPDLFLLKSRVSGKAFLARHESGALRIYFMLVKSTTHQPDATALPPVAETEKALADHAETFLRLKLES